MCINQSDAKALFNKTAIKKEMWKLGRREGKGLPHTIQLQPPAQHPSVLCPSSFLDAPFKSLSRVLIAVPLLAPLQGKLQDAASRLPGLHDQTTLDSDVVRP